MEKKVLYLVVPCYNESEILNDSAARLQDKMTNLITNKQIAPESKILFVDDGSKDNTYQIIATLHQSNPLFVGVKLAHNRGQQNAILAGLEVAHARADMMITLDADLQDDIDAIDKMIEEYDKGAEVVFGVRSSRKKDTFFKRFTAQAFYKLMHKMGAETIYNHADFRLMSKTVITTLLQYQETNLFIRGIVPQIGYQTATVTYERQKRTKGESKYPLKSMLRLALNGMTSSSTKFLSLIWWWGLFFNILGLAGTVTTIVLKYTINLDAMWCLLSAMVWLTGVIMLALGVIGLYLGKVYIESKHRPRYTIEKVLD